MTLQIITPYGALLGTRLYDFLVDLRYEPILFDVINIPIARLSGALEFRTRSYADASSITSRQLPLVNETVTSAFDRATEHCNTFRVARFGDLPLIVDSAIRHMRREGRTPTRLVVLENKLYLIEPDDMVLYLQRGSGRQAIYAPENSIVRISLPYSLDQAQEP
jgi:hypothetical protein